MTPDNIERPEELLLEVELHAAVVFHDRVDSKVRPKLLHTPGCERHRVEVTLAIATQAALPCIGRDGRQVLAGRSRHQKNRGVERKVLYEIVQGSAPCLASEEIPYVARQVAMRWAPCERRVPCSELLDCSPESGLNLGKGRRDEARRSRSEGAESRIDGYSG